MKNKAFLNQLDQINKQIFYSIILLLPFWTFLATWVGSNFGNDELLKALIDGLIFFNLFLTLILIKFRVGARKFFASKLNKLIVAYALVSLAFLPFYQDTLTSFAVGLIFNLRFLALFIVARYVTYKNPNILYKYLVYGVGAVAIFGVLQTFFLPNDFLEYFGYSETTIKPFLTVDDNSNFVRINSFLRGPNPLGAYMAWTFMLVLGLSFKNKKLLYLLPLILITLASTFSRSAMLGLGVALLLFFGGKYKEIIKRNLSLVLIPFVVVLGLAFAFTDSRLASVVLFHDDPTDGIERTSNTDRADSIERSISDIRENPLGDGPGTSGPASRYGDSSELSENYYLQIARDSGVIGLALLLGIVYVLMKQIYSDEIMDTVAITALLGFLSINLFLHAWADSTSTLLFWAFLGSRFKEKV